ncbi:MAG TPA: HAMP domain-containing sensor histidine kinase [Candidatus Limnocylindria bacterium]|nr:HAMP domain-containing sensor histidine kinase [Candidatus Limnocylindria bacterium]
MPKLQGAPRAVAILAAHWLAITILGWTDFVADSEVRVGLMFVPLVASATALLGKRAGIATGAYATVTLMLANDLVLPLETAVFNNVVRVIGFITIALLVDRVVQQTRALRRQQAQLEREMATRAEYTSLVAHELRNPLVSINAAARTIAKQRDPAAVADGIAAESTAALELLDSLSDVASIEAGRLRSALQRMDLAELVRKVVSSTDAGEHEFRLHGAQQDLVVLGDPHRLAQVLKNLLSNAVKYSPGRTPIDITLGLSGDRARAVVAVRDLGPGVPPAERPRLFEKFARLSTAGGTRGSGLGLYICRQILRDHDGDLFADWPPGGGSLFSFELPAVGSRATDPNVPPARRPRVKRTAPAVERRRQANGGRAS